MVPYDAKLTDQKVQSDATKRDGLLFSALFFKPQVVLRSLSLAFSFTL